MANPILTNGLGSPQSIYGEVKVIHTDQSQNISHLANHRVGTRGYLPDGRVYYYATNGAVALTAGSALMLAATTGLNIVASDNAIILTASFGNFKAGAQNGIKLLGTDIETADIIEGSYAEGYLYFEKVAPLGEYYKIRHNQSINNDDAIAGTIDLYDPLKTSSIATTQISFAKNIYHRTITTSTAQNEAVIGVAPIAITASGAVPTDAAAAEAKVNAYTYWAQTWGPCCVEIGDTSVAPGVAAMSGGTADRLDIAATSGHTSNQTTMGGVETPHVAWGLVSAAAGAGDAVLVDLRCRP